MCARKLDRGFDSLAPGTAKESLFQASACEAAKSSSQFAGQFRNMALQHRWTTSGKLVLKGGNDLGMIVACVVNAISGKEIEEHPTVRREQFRTLAAFIRNVHLQQVK